MYKLPALRKKPLFALHAAFNDVQITRLGHTIKYMVHPTYGTPQRSIFHYVVFDTSID